MYFSRITPKVYKLRIKFNYLCLDIFIFPDLGILIYTSIKKLAYVYIFLSTYKKNINKKYENCKSYFTHKMKINNILKL